MNEYGSDILSTRKQNRSQILSSSSDESSNEGMEFDDSEPEGTKSDDSDCENIESDTENQNINVEGNIREVTENLLNFLPNLAISSIYLEHPNISVHFIWKYI